jgi:predicted nucleic-acid-binding Zn-ribbon protein
MSEAQQDRPKHLAPWTCPKCGEHCGDVEHGYKDYGESVRYSITCPKCGCWFHHHETVTYEPACVEVDGVRYDYPKEAEPSAWEHGDELLFAAERVIANWEHGDLAGAVRELDRIVKEVKGV